jgi:hypothetical protein
MQKPFYELSQENIFKTECRHPYRQNCSLGVTARVLGLGAVPVGEPQGARLGLGANNRRHRRHCCRRHLR